ncbi:hypothetical protein [Microvirga sp. KLBC 81]|uniref:hypothetical protein n=1 Tax=Microvirga sp. KLBC 81 TaxID=1862707 RepID=UPI00197B699F|nr:hypothetical protein [Microvirga sp. KLBC 81]
MDSINLSCPLPADHGRTGEPAAGPVQIDPAASAALAEAVRSARQGLMPTPTPAQEESTNQEAPAAASSSRSSFLTQAATAVLLIGAGWLASYMGTLANREAIHRMEAETARSQEILSKLTDDLAALKSTMAAARDVAHTASISKASDQPKLAEKVDRLAIAIQEPGKKLSALEERLNRMESQIMASLNGLSASKPAATAAAPANESERESAPAAKQARTEPVEGWVLREVYNGSALVESRNRGIYEVMPGNVIPGVGRVEAIERRGGRWVVVTDKGLISTYR